MATGSPPKFLPTLTEVVNPPAAVSAHTNHALPTQEMVVELMETVRAQVRTELQMELQLLAMSSAQAHLDALLPLMERHIESAIHEVLSRNRRP